MFTDVTFMANIAELRLEAAEVRFLASTFVCGEAMVDLPAHASTLEAAASSLE